jgi:hypothetical protein
MAERVSFDYEATASDDEMKLVMTSPQMRQRDGSFTRGQLGPGRDYVRISFETDDMDADQKLIEEAFSYVGLRTPKFIGRTNAKGPI